MHAAHFMMPVSHISPSRIQLHGAQGSDQSTGFVV